MSDIPQLTITKSSDDMEAAAPAQTPAQARPSTVATSIISLQNPEVLQVIDSNESIKSAAAQSACTHESMGFHPRCESDPSHHARCNYCLELAKQRVEETIRANQREIDPLTQPTDGRAATPPSPPMNRRLTAAQQYQQRVGGTVRFPAYDYVEPRNADTGPSNAESSMLTPHEASLLVEKHPRDPEIINPGVLNAHEALGRPKKTPSVFQVQEPIPAQNGHATSTTGSVSTEKSNFYFRAGAEKNNYSVPHCCVIC